MSIKSASASPSTNGAILMRRSFLLTAIILFAVVASACGGGGENANPVGPTSGAASGGTPSVTQTITGTVSAFGSTRHSLGVTRAGSMTLRLTWADASVDLDLYLTSPGCTTDLYPMSSCGVLLTSDASTGTQETIARTVSNGEQFQIWVDNLNATLPQTYTVSMVIQ
jgi:hypothetical protein